MLLYIKIIFQASVIYLWFMAWLLITAMPVIHAHSHVLGMMHHSPPANAENLNSSQQKASHSHTKVDASYKCPLCHFSPRLFEQALQLHFTHQSFYSLQFSQLESFHSLTILFKPARAPPLIIG